MSLLAMLIHALQSNRQHHFAALATLFTIGHSKGAFTQSAVTDGTWLDFGSGREWFRPSPRVQPQINKRVAADRAASGA